MAGVRIALASSSACHGCGIPITANVAFLLVLIIFFVLSCVVCNPEGLQCLPYFCNPYLALLHSPMSIIYFFQAVYSPAACPVAQT
jgi:hypothetical protein